MNTITWRLAQQQLQQTDCSSRLIFLHPQFSAQLGLITPKPHTLYMRLADPWASVEMGQARVLERASESGFALADAELVLLDEADRMDKAILPALLRWLLDQAPQARLVVLSRGIIRSVLDDPHLRDQARFVPANESLQLWDYARRSETSGTLLEVRALSGGQVLLDGQPVEQWDGALPRALFYYLVDRGMVTRTEIFETFWRSLSSREATNVFHVTKRKINEVLSADLTVYWSGFYHISPRIELSYDVALFTQAIQHASVAHAGDAAVLLEHALALYRTDYLRGNDMAWAKQRRDDLNTMLCDACLQLARIYEQSGETRQAMRVLLRAAAVNPYREDVALALMQACRALNWPDYARAIYQRTERLLNEGLSLAPGRELSDLAALVGYSDAASELA
ncbi:MAG: bacterial transcriptional activator domain-containing protein [Aggregatilineales bacterium]